MNDYNNWRGKAVLDKDGKKIGTIGDLYVSDGAENDAHAKPKFATVKTGFFGTKENFFPVALAEVRGEDIVLNTTEEHVKNAPKIDVDDILGSDEENQIYQYYEVKSSDRGGSNGLNPDNENGHDTSGPTTDDAMTRSEEKMEVGVQKQEIGRIRLKKYIVTEHVTQTVPVQREEVRLEREPITEDNIGNAMDGPELSEEEHEVILSKEVPVVTMKTVPVERVRLSKELVQDQQTVERDVRKEQIDVAGHGDQR